jgi:hypothetical protein
MDIMRAPWLSNDDKELEVRSPAQHCPTGGGRDGLVLWRSIAWQQSRGATGAREHTRRRR